MSTGLASFTNIDGIFEETARAIFDEIKPSILLIGEWDEHFEKIASLYKWAEHKPTAPRALGADIALVVTNSGKGLSRILALAHPYTAVLAYDDNSVIPLARRIDSSLHIVCYLNNVSERFISGHIKALLQLQKHFITLDGDVPIIVTLERARVMIDQVFHSLDAAGRAGVNCDQIDTFFACFAAFAELTSYEAPVLVSSPAVFAERVKKKNKTLVLLCRKKADVKAYMALGLEKRAIVFVHHYAKAGSRELDFRGIGRRDADYYLAAYFLSLQYNLHDPLHGTRFIQLGDIDQVRAAYPEPQAFCARVRALLDAGELRFRNIAPRIRDVDYAAQLMAELMMRFDKTAYAELFAKCDGVLETAQMVSGIPQTTLSRKK